MELKHFIDTFDQGGVEASVDIDSAHRDEALSSDGVESTAGLEICSAGMEATDEDSGNTGRKMRNYGTNDFYTIRP